VPAIGRGLSGDKEMVDELKRANSEVERGGSGDHIGDTSSIDAKAQEEGAGVGEKNGRTASEVNQSFSLENRRQDEGKKKKKKRRKLNSMGEKKKEHGKI